MAEMSFQSLHHTTMDNNFESGVIEKSQLLKATLPFQWLYTLFGLQMPPVLYGGRSFKICSWLAVLLMPCYIVHSIILVVMVIWMVYINNVVVEVIVDNLDLDSITSVLSISQNISVAFVQVLMHLSALEGYKKLQNIHRQVAQLERDILWYYRDFENDSNSMCVPFLQRCRTFQRRLLQGPLLFFLLHTFFLSYSNYPLVADMMAVRDKVLTIFCFQLIQTKCSEYGVVMYVLNEFLTALQQSLLQLKYDIVRTQARRQGGGVESPFYRKLMAHQYLLSRIWCLVKYVEEYFALPMLILFLYNGIAITHTINWAYIRSFQYDGNDCCQHFRLWFIFLVFLNMLRTCWLSQICIDKYNRMSSVLHDLKMKSCDLALKQRLREYSLQLMHQKMLFTCAGFFDINLKSFGLMMLSITTYIIILIQFKLQAETEKSKIRL